MGLAAHMGEDMPTRRQVLARFDRRGRDFGLRVPRPREEQPGGRTTGRSAGRGLVRPLQNDTSDQIVSWVDGQIVTDWAAETAKRQRAIDGYLDDTDPARAEKYGFRSGQNPQLAWHWFRNNPVGFNGVPFVLFKTILDLDPDHENPTLRTIARIWKREAVVPSTAGTAATGWTLDHIGIGADPSDYVNGVVRPADERQSPLPFGFAFENPRTFEPLSSVETTAVDGRLLARRVFQNTTLLMAKLEQADKEENWEKDRPGFGSPGNMDRVFFSCAACHVGRVMVGGKMTFLIGMPNTEIEAQYYSKLLMLTGAALVESGFDPASTTPVDPTAIKPKTSAIRALYTEMLNKARLRPETLYGSSPADVARGKLQALAIAAEFPSVMQDLIADWREDALHLPRRRPQQRLQAAASGYLRRPPWPDGCVRHRLGAGRDPHPSTRQQLSGVRAPRQS